jgi:hypothetical protein
MKAPNGECPRDAFDISKGVDLFSVRAMRNTQVLSSLFKLLANDGLEISLIRGSTNKQFISHKDKRGLMSGLPID